MFRRQVAAVDGAIDSLVYELYGLTAEEIKIVNGQWLIVNCLVDSLVYELYGLTAEEIKIVNG